MLDVALAAGLAAVALNAPQPGGQGGGSRQPHIVGNVVQTLQELWKEGPERVVRQPQSSPLACTLRPGVQPPPGQGAAASGRLCTQSSRARCWGGSRCPGTPQWTQSGGVTRPARACVLGSLGWSARLPASRRPPPSPAEMLRVGPTSTGSTASRLVQPAEQTARAQPQLPALRPCRLWGWS